MNCERIPTGHEPWAAKAKPMPINMATPCGWLSSTKTCWNRCGRERPLCEKERIGYWLLVIGYWLLVIGYWLLVIGYWLLVIGYWLLVIGYWLLVIGYWLLVIGYWL